MSLHDCANYVFEVVERFRLRPVALPEGQRPSRRTLSASSVTVWRCL